MNGWIKIARAITEHWIWEDPHHLKWWLDLLTMAAMRDCGGLRRGQLRASVRFLRERWSYTDKHSHKRVKPSQASVTSFLKRLEDDGMITRTQVRIGESVGAPKSQSAGTPRGTAVKQSADTPKSQSADTLIFIVNYDKYQAFAPREKKSADTPKSQSADTPTNDSADTERGCAQNAERGCKDKEYIYRDDEMRACVRGWEGFSQSNQAFLSSFFAVSNSFSLEQFTMALHRDNPKILSVDDWMPLAIETVAQWEMDKDSPTEQANFNRRLRGTVAAKARDLLKSQTLKDKKNGNGHNGRPASSPADRAADKHERDTEFMLHIAQKLSRG